MKLYIFRCRARPRMYGATRYETGANLPDKHKGGWEFCERLDLTPRTTLRFLVDIDILRRQVKLRGWHVWDETRDAVKDEVRKLHPPHEHQRPAVSRVHVESGMVPDYSRKEAAYSIPSVRDHQPLPEELEAEELEMEQLETQEFETEELEIEAAEMDAEPEPAPAPEPVPEPAKSVVPRTTSGALPSRQAGVVTHKHVETPKAIPALPARNQVVWFDIPVRDIDRAVRFYSAVLGTPLKKEQAGPGAAVAVLPYAEGFAGGSLIQNIDAKPSESGPLLYLNTHGRLEEALNAVEKHGGKVLAETHSIAPFGFRAIVLDSEGNRIALHSM